MFKPPKKSVDSPVQRVWTKNVTQPLKRRLQGLTGD